MKLSIEDAIKAMEGDRNFGRKVIREALSETGIQRDELTLDDVTRTLSNLLGRLQREDFTTIFEDLCLAMAIHLLVQMRDNPDRK